jgi:hypothetical protein
LSLSELSRAIKNLNSKGKEARASRLEERVVHEMRNEDRVIRKMVKRQARLGRRIASRHGGGGCCADHKDGS